MHPLTLALLHRVRIDNGQDARWPEAVEWRASEAAMTDAPQCPAPTFPGNYWRQEGDRLWVAEVLYPSVSCNAPLVYYDRGSRREVEQDGLWLGECVAPRVGSV